MTLTDQHIRALVFLAKESRPSGARRWDEAGTFAAIAKVADRNLADVIMAVTRAAADRDVESPGVIPTNGSHWSEQLAPQPFVPQTSTPGERCSICSKARDLCPRGRVADDDHEFESAATAARRHAETDPDAIRGAIAALREDMPVTAPPTPSRTLDELAAADPELHARVQHVRAQMPMEAMRESIEEAN